MKFLAAVFMTSLSICAGAAVLEGLDGAEGKVVTIANLEERDGYIIVTFSGPLQKGAACASRNRDKLLIEWPNTRLGETAKNAFALGQAVDVYGAAVCKKVKDIEAMSSMQIVK